jgi:hypothetical protein
MSKRSFAIAVAAILAIYLAIELAYVVHAPRFVDEYGNAFTLNRLRSELAYRDFRPPKTVLAYYIELLPVLAIRDPWDGMTAAKAELALLAAAALAAAAFALRKRLDPRAVLAALALLVVMSNFLERSGELRPDALATLFGLVSLLFLTARRNLLAGVACAAAFLCTQKGIYFVAAGEIALGAVWIRDRSWQRFRSLVVYNLAAAATLVAYVIFWSLLASRQAVFSSIFFDPNVRAIAFTKIYDIRAQFWTQTLIRNPFFYGLTAAGLLILGKRWLVREDDDVVLPYAAAMFALALWHKQPWPYFFAMIVPTFFVLQAFTLDELQARPSSPNRRRAFIVALIAFGLLLPLSRVPIGLARDGGFHRAMFEAGEQLLGPGETYLDGTGMLFRRAQAHPEFNWLDASAVTRLQHLSDSELRKIAAELEANPPKLVIWNYRMAALPPLLEVWMLTHYAPMYGDILYYAPVARGRGFTIAFDGRYRIGNAAVVIDGAPASGEIVLHRGMHSFGSGAPLRLRLIPPAAIQADMRYAAPQNLFADAYAF